MSKAKTHSGFSRRNIQGKYYNTEQAFAVVEQYEQEKKLRQQHPGLQEAYNTYQELLALAGSDKLPLQ